VPANYPDAPGPGNGLPALPSHLDPRGKHHRGAGRRRASGGQGRGQGPTGGGQGPTGGGRRPPSDGRHRVGLATLALCTLLSVFLFATFGVYWWKYHAFNAGLHKLHIFGSSADKPSHDIDGKSQNILIVGNDDRSTATDAELKQLGTGRDGGSLNTDTMMIVHVPADGKKATLISLPRDSYVSIPGHGQAKLNSAYPDGYSAENGKTDEKRAAGAKLLTATIQHLTGLTIDHFVQVDLLGFYRISKAIHGIKVNMCNAVKESNSGIDLHKGINTIEGKQALAFVRQRYNFPDGNGDLDRVQRQRYFLTAAFRKLASAGVILNPIKLQSLLTAVQSSVYLDDQLKPLDLAKQMEDLSADNILGKTIPTDGFGTSDDGQSIVKVNSAEVKAFVNKLIGSADSKLGSAKVVAPSSVTVDIMNAGSFDGAATQNADVLRAQGFVIGNAGTSGSPNTSTVIEYPDGMQAQAKTLAAYVPGATMQQVSSAKHVTLLLGADQLNAKALPKKTTGSSPSGAHVAAPAKPAKPRAIDSGCIN
jgi:LCP family protein required for cell wall assembly